MAKFTGVKLKFNDDHECTDILPGKAILPHRVDLIEEKINNKDFSGLDDMFFNFKLKGCRTASSHKDIERESSLMDRYFEMIEKGDFDPDAA